MSVLVFGKTGQVARELARLCPEACFAGRDMADLSDPAACAALIAQMQPRIVINAAAYTAVDQAEDQEALATVINGEAPKAMAKAAAATGAVFVHISTDYVFDGSGDAPWTPDAPTAPPGAYGRSKLAGEAGVRRAGGTHAILRTAWVFSAHGNNFVKTMRRAGATRDSLTVVGDQYGGPTPAADIAATVLRIADMLVADPGLTGTYHYCGTPDTTWADFARAVFRSSGMATRVEDIPTSAWPTPARRPANSRLDCTSLKTAFGITRPDWQAGLEAVITELETTDEA